MSTVPHKTRFALYKRNTLDRKKLSLQARDHDMQILYAESRKRLKSGW
jgi:hypothetical protein